MEGILQPPDKLLEEAGVEAWTQRMLDVSGDPAAVRRLTLEAPEGRVREIALDRAMWMLAPAHPWEAIALVEATQDTDQFHREALWQNTLHAATRTSPWICWNGIRSTGSLTGWAMTTVPLSM